MTEPETTPELEQAPEPEPQQDERPDGAFVTGQPEPEPHGPFVGSCSAQGRNPEDPTSWLPRTCTRGQHTGTHAASGPGLVGTPAGGSVVLAAWS